MTRPYAGIGECPDCGERVLFAVEVTGDLVALSNGSDGPAAVRWDTTGTPRVRSVEPGYRTREGEHRFRLHIRSCPALAPVIPLTGRVRRPEPERRRASAR